MVATFEYQHDIASPAGAANFAVGCILILDILTRFHSPIRLASGYASIMINQPRAIGKFYVTRCPPLPTSRNCPQGFFKCEPSILI